MTEVNGQETADPMIPPSTHRVKLYQLNVDTNWEDKGTGYCILKQGMDGQPNQLIVESEEDKDILLTSNIIKRRLYQRQEDTLIVWTEDDSRDLALSFQDPVGREEIWQYIHKSQLNASNQKDGSSSPTKELPETVSLPTPDLSNLKEIADIMSIAHTLNDKDRLSSYILMHSYIEKLAPLFETCEDLEDIKDLHLLYNAMLAILTLNDQSIVEQVVSDDLVMDVMGIFEYNPKTPTMKANHREFIKSRGNAKQLLDLKDETISKKIDQTFRLEYLQGILLNNDSDEGLMGVINNVIYQNHVDIIGHIQTNHTLLSHLFGIVKNEKESDSKRRETARFIQQLCLVTKQMQNSVRINMYRSLTTYGLLDLMSFALSDSDKSIRIGCLNILATFTDLDISFVRSNILSQYNKKTGNPLIEVIVNQFIKEDDYDAKVQYFKILRLLLDPSGNSANGPSMAVDALCKQEPETDDFMALFHEKYLTVLLEPIRSIESKPIHLTGHFEPLELTQDQAQLRLYICEFIYFAIRNHGYRSKYMMLSCDLYSKITQLFRCRYSYVKLGVVRIMRLCASLDEFYVTNLINFNTFEPFIRVLLDTQGRDCLLNSACLELLEFIMREKIQPLMSHLISQFGYVLDTITYISTCVELRKVYEQMKAEASEKKPIEDTETSSNETSEKMDKLDGWTTTTIDDEEEEYFNGSDEEDTPKIPTLPNPLVNYEDDEEEEEDDKEKSNRTKEDETMTDVNDLNINRSKRTLDQIEDDTIDSPSSPPLPFFARKEAEEEEDALARPSRQSPISPTKKIVIKTSNIKRMRSSQ
ncbi:component of IIS longevity pathway SMK-1-domain-containing protein [Pilobolus umbonatus]|nr:component of IIS longevity pathway SMK-1-domain-containing protein [Pilobolus umbonatus]